MATSFEDEENCPTAKCEYFEQEIKRLKELIRHRNGQIKASMDLIEAMAVQAFRMAKESRTLMEKIQNLVKLNCIEKLEKLNAHYEVKTKYFKCVKEILCVLHFKVTNMRNATSFIEDSIANTLKLNDYDCKCNKLQTQLENKCAENVQLCNQLKSITDEKCGIESNCVNVKKQLRDIDVKFKDFVKIRDDLKEKNKKLEQERDHFKQKFCGIVCDAKKCSLELEAVKRDNEQLMKSKECLKTRIKQLLCGNENQYSNRIAELEFELDKSRENECKLLQMQETYREKVAQLECELNKQKNVPLHGPMEADRCYEVDVHRCAMPEVYLDKIKELEIELARNQLLQENEKDMQEEKYRTKIKQLEYHIQVLEEQSCQSKINAEEIHMLHSTIEEIRCNLKKAMDIQEEKDRAYQHDVDKLNDVIKDLKNQLKCEATRSHDAEHFNQIIQGLKDDLKNEISKSEKKLKKVSFQDMRRSNACVGVRYKDLVEMNNSEIQTEENQGAICNPGAICNRDTNDCQSQTDVNRDPICKRQLSDCHAQTEVNRGVICNPGAICNRDTNDCQAQTEVSRETICNQEIIKNKEDIIKIQNDTFNIMKVELQMLKKQEDELLMQREHYLAETKELKRRIQELECGLKISQERASNLQTAVDLYLNSINVLEVSEEKHKLEIEQQKMTINNLQEALVSSKHNLDELKLKTEETIQEQKGVFTILYAFLVDAEEQKFKISQQYEELCSYVANLQEANFELEMEHCKVLQDAEDLDVQVHKYLNALSLKEKTEECSKRYQDRLTCQKKYYEKIVGYFKSEMKSMSEQLQTLQGLLTSSHMSTEQETAKLNQTLRDVTEINKNLTTKLTAMEQQIQLENQMNQLNESKIADLRKLLNSQDSHNCQYQSIIKDIKSNLKLMIEQNSELKGNIKDITDNMNILLDAYHHDDLNKQCRKVSATCTAKLNQCTINLAEIKGMIDKKEYELKTIEVSFNKLYEDHQHTLQKLDKVNCDMYDTQSNLRQMQHCFLELCDKQKKTLRDLQKANDEIHVGHRDMNELQECYHDLFDKHQMLLKELDTVKKKVCKHPPVHQYEVIDAQVQSNRCEIDTMEASTNCDCSQSLCSCKDLNLELLLEQKNNQLNKVQTSLNSFSDEIEIALQQQGSCCSFQTNLNDLQNELQVKYKLLHKLQDNLHVIKKDLESALKKTQKAKPDDKAKTVYFVEHLTCSKDDKSGDHNTGSGSMTSITELVMDLNKEDPKVCDNSFDLIQVMKKKDEKIKQLEKVLDAFKNNLTESTSGDLTVTQMQEQIEQKNCEVNGMKTILEEVNKKLTKTMEELEKTREEVLSKHQHDLHKKSEECLKKQDEIVEQQRIIKELQCQLDEVRAKEDLIASMQQIMTELKQKADVVKLKNDEIVKLQATIKEMEVEMQNFIECNCKMALEISNSKVQLDNLAKKDQELGRYRKILKEFKTTLEEINRGLIMKNKSEHNQNKDLNPVIEMPCEECEDPEMLCLCEVEFYKHVVDSLTENVVSLKKKLTELQVKYKAADSCNKQKDEKIEQLTATCAEKDKAYHNLQNTLTEQLQRAQQEEEKYRELSQKLDKEMKQLKQDLEGKTAKIWEAKKTIKELNGSKSVQLACAQDEIVVLKNELNRLIKKQNQLTVENEKLHIQIANLTSTINGLQERNDMLKSQLEQYVQSFTQLQYQKDELAQKNKELLNELRNLQSSYSLLNRQQRYTSDSVKNLEAEIDVLKTNREEICYESKNVVAYVKAWLSEQKKINDFLCQRDTIEQFDDKESMSTNLEKRQYYRKPERMSAPMPRPPQPQSPWSLGSQGTASLYDDRETIQSPSLECEWYSTTFQVDSEYESEEENWAAKVENLAAQVRQTNTVWKNKMKQQCNCDKTVSRDVKK